jgi:sirohydrochlorin ferrochelatase
MLKLIELMGYEQIIVLPLMFFPGVYTDKIYLAAEEFRIQSPVQVRIADPLGSGDLLIQAMNLRIDEAVAELGLL